jgi:GxxExxY protein
MNEMKNFDHYNPLTHKIIGSAMEVHKFLGNGFQEVIYQRALALEFEKQGLGFARELEMPIYYHEVEIGTRRVDFLVEEKVLVELKAVSELDNNHMNQIMNYLQAYQLEIGLLINFGENSLKFKRFVLSNHKYNPNRK